MKLTTKWLIEKQGCPEGVKWFKRNYPNGLVLTKKNINELVGKLLRKRRGWQDDASGNEETCVNLHWLLETATGKISLGIFGLDWDIATQKEIAEAFWKDYKGLRNEQR